MHARHERGKVAGSSSRKKTRAGRTVAFAFLLVLMMNSPTLAADFLTVTWEGEFWQFSEDPQEPAQFLGRPGRTGANAMAIDSTGRILVGGTGPYGNLQALSLDAVTLEPFATKEGLSITLSSVRGMAFDAQDRLFAVTRSGSSGSSQASLDRVDLETGAVERIATWPSDLGIQSLSFAEDGQLYGWNVRENVGLMRIDPETGAIEDVDSTLPSIFDVQGMTLASDGRLLGISGLLLEIEPDTGGSSINRLVGGPRSYRGLVQLPAIPEPGTALLLGLGLAALARTHRR